MSPGRRDSLLVMRIVRFIATTALVIFCGATAGAQDGAVGDGEFGPYLTKVTQDAITVSWHTLEPTTTVVQYGSDDSYGSTYEDESTSQLHHARLEGLEPGATVHYRVESRDGAGNVSFESDDQTFRTAPAARETFRFVFFAEVHHAADVASFETQVSDFDPWFQIQPGDNVDDGNHLGQWESFFTQGDWYGRLPLFNVLGNHEFNTFTEEGQDGNILGSLGEVPLELLGGPGNGRWYAFEYGGVLFLGLDSNGLLYSVQSQDALVTQQLEWLDQTLADATDGEDDPGLIIAFFHTPPWGSNLWNPLRTVERTWVQDNFVTRLEEGGVALVLVGHDKFYERSEKDGVVYLMVASGAGPREADRPDLNPYAVVTDDQVLTTALIEIEDGCRAMIDVRDPDGNQIDSLEIVGNCPPADADDDSSGGGCGCRVAGGGTGDGAAFVLLVVVCALLRRRHRAHAAP